MQPDENPKSRIERRAETPPFFVHRSQFSAVKTTMYTSDSELYVTKECKLTATIRSFRVLTQEDYPVENIHQSQIQIQLVQHFLAASEGHS